MAKKYRDKWKKLSKRAALRLILRTLYKITYYKIVLTKEAYEKKFGLGNARKKD